MLKISNLSKSFGNKKILDDISLSVDSGEIALLLGSSGVGKSTLLRVLNNLEVPDSGEITLDGTRLNLAAVNKTHVVGMVFQQFNLFEHMTVEENITFPLEKALGLSSTEAKKRAQELLANYNLKELAHHYASELSGGQKQRLAIARTIALKPQVICLDEPTSALDPLLTNYVADSIQQLATQNYTVLVASHDIKLLEKLNCTIYLMQHGKIIQSAKSQDFRVNKEKYPAINKFVLGHIH